MEDIKMETDHVVQRLGPCQTCKMNPSKYRCPGCLIVSCSAQCVSDHKKAKDCDGVRSKSKFVSLHEFSELDLLNDYRFLEAANRCIENKARDKLKQFTRKGETAMQLPLHLRQLHKACFVRGCRILFLPPHFERHRTNSTRMNYRTREIAWKVEFVFVHAQKTVILEKVDERSKLSDLLSSYLSDVNIFVGKRQKLSQDQSHEFEDPFFIYKSKNFNEIKVLLKAEGIHKKPRRFYTLEMDKSLAWNLKNKLIVENPIIYVIFKDHESYFDNGFESDDEEKEDGSGKSSLGQITPKTEVIVEESESHKDSSEIKHFSNMTFKDPSAAEHEPMQGDPTLETDPTYNKYYEYYFKYYVNKFGVNPETQAHDQPAKTTAAPPMATVTTSTAPVTTSTAPVLQPTIAPKASSGLFLVDYSGSEDEDN